MTLVATIQVGHSQFDDRLWALAGRFGRSEPRDEFSGLDYFELLPSSYGPAHRSSTTPSTPTFTIAA
jgi:hypothetical protein